MSALVQSGYAMAKALTRRHSRSFYFSSLALFGPRRRASFALYAFCRRLDDLVDGDDARGPAQRSERLALARATVSALYGHEPRRVLGDLPWHPGELAALRDTIERFAVPEQPLQELVSGMEMDLVKARYATFDELHLYCYRVAGVVGLLMTPVLGYRDARCLPYAVDLGVAMQLTNILRDVKEDLARGRVYLPADELAAFGISGEQLAAGRVDDGWTAFMRFQIARARAFYARSALGVPDLGGPVAQRVVRLMGAVYGGILGAIEANGYDVFSTRARVGLGTKLRLAAGALLTPAPAPRLVEVPRLEGSRA